MNPTLIMNLALAFKMMLAKDRNWPSNAPLPPIETIKNNSTSAINSDPTLRNDLNMEPIWNSRVAVYSAGGFLAALGIVLGEIGVNGIRIDRYHHETFWPALAAVFFSGKAFLARVRTGVAEMRWFGWFRKKVK